MLGFQISCRPNRPLDVVPVSHSVQGSLRGQLDLKQEGLNWAQRVHVALGAACGLAYLHDEAEPPVGGFTQASSL